MRPRTALMVDHPEPQPQLTARVSSVGEVLSSMELNIPPYQRPYTWSVKSIGDLVDDVRRFRQAGHYRIGTFILHDPSPGPAGATIEAPRPGRGPQLNIVDGQQRYLSFALIAHALLTRTATLPDHLAAELRASVEDLRIPNRADGRSERNLRQNYDHLVEQVTEWSAEELNGFTEFFLKECSVVVLQVDELDAAFQMFDSQNTRGRPLYPTDLLKAYHLRELSRTNPTRDALLETVRRWEAIPPAEINHVIAAVLFPIKRWSLSRRVPSSGFTAHHVGLFKGIREGVDGNGHYRWAHPVLLAKAAVDRYQDENRTLLRHGVLDTFEFPFHIVDPVIDGQMFFRMVDHYVQQARLAGVQGPTDSSQERAHDGALDSILGTLAGVPRNTGNRYIRELFDCLLMAYLDRFGWHEVQRAGLVLARYAYLLRLHLERVQLSSVDRHARGAHERVADVTGNLFAEIATALDPQSVLSRPLPQVAEDVAGPKGLADLYASSVQLSTEVCP